MLILAVQQTMVEKVREVANIAPSCCFWDVGDLKLLMTAGVSTIRSTQLKEAGIAHSWALFFRDPTANSPTKKGQVRFAHDGECILSPTPLDETEFELCRMRLVPGFDKGEHLLYRMPWVLICQESWDNQQHNGNMFLMRKMLTM